MTHNSGLLQSNVTLGDRVFTHSCQLQILFLELFRRKHKTYILLLFAETLSLLVRILWQRLLGLRLSKNVTSHSKLLNLVRRLVVFIIVPGHHDWWRVHCLLNHLIWWFLNIIWLIFRFRSLVYSRRYLLILWHIFDILSHISL